MFYFKKKKLNKCAPFRIPRIESTNVKMGPQEQVISSTVLRPMNCNDVYHFIPTIILRTTILSFSFFPFHFNNSCKNLLFSARNFCFFFLNFQGTFRFLVVILISYLLKHCVKSCVLLNFNKNFAFLGF